MHRLIDAFQRFFQFDRYIFVINISFYRIFMNSDGENYFSSESE